MGVDVVVRSVLADAVSAFDSVLGGGAIGMAAALLLAGSNALGPLAVGAILGSSLAASRCLRISLRMGEDGVRIANYFRTWRLSWTDVSAIGWDRFEVPHASAPSVAFRLVDGETVVAEAAWGLGRRRRERVVESVHELARRNEIACYLASGDIKFSTGHHVNKPLSEHPALPKVDRRIALVRRHPRLGWVFAAAILAAFVLIPLAVRAFARS